MGAIRGWRKCILTLRWTSVIPAPAVNSAADSVVGTAVMRIRSESSGDRGGAPRFGASVDSVSTSRTPRHSAISMVLVASITEPPPTASRWSASASRATAAPAITASRGEWALIAENLPTQRSPSAEVTSRTSRPSVSDRVVSEQHALRADALDLRAHGLGRRLAVDHAFLRRPFERSGQHVLPIIPSSITHHVPIRVFPAARAAAAPAARPCACRCAAGPRRSRPSPRRRACAARAGARPRADRPPLPASRP